MKKKILSSVLFLSLLLSAAACGEGAENPAETADTADTTGNDTEKVTEAVILPDLPEMNWNGEDFHVLGKVDTTNPQFSNFEIDSEGEDGEVVNDAIFRRNTTVEDRYNVTISQDLVPEPNTTIAQLIRAGDDVYDLTFCCIDLIGSLGEKGLFYNLNDVNYIDFTKPYWNPDVNEAVMIKDKLFYTSSDFSLRDKSRAYIMLYNPELAGQYDIPDLVDTIRGGKWTVELMDQYCRMVSGDVDGNSIMDENDQYGLGMDSYNAFAAFMMGCNVRMVENPDNIPKITINSEHTVDSVDRVIRLTCDTDTALFCNDFEGRVEGNYWGVHCSVFYAGRALFMTAFPHDLKMSSNACDFEYLVVPFPKYDESQEKYLTMANTFCMLFGIPVSVQNPDFSGFMLEALSAESTNTSLNAYYSVSCKTKYSYNEESAEMLDLIFDGIVYDNAVLYRSALGLYDIFARTLPQKKQNVFVSEYARLESKAQTALDRLLKSIDSIGN